MENIIVKIVDQIAPLVAQNSNLNKQRINPKIKNLINKRKRFIRIDKIRATNANAPKIKTLGFEIRQLFENEIKSRVRSAATGNSGNLWKAVKRSKNINSETIPKNMTVAGLPVAVDERAQKFAVIIINRQ